MNRTCKTFILASAIGMMAVPAMAGVMVLPANEITFNPPLDTLNPTHSGYWWSPENVFEDDSLFAVDTVIQFRYDSLGVGFTDPGSHPDWVITNVSISAKHRAHYWKTRARFIPYVGGVPLFDENDTLLVWPPVKFGSTEMTNTVEITQLDTALADSAWGWDDIAALSLKYEPRSPNVVYYINHLYATITYVDTATADTGHYFSFDPISDPQLLGISFPIKIYARDIGGAVITTYNDSTYISDLTGTITPNVVHFSAGVCSTMVTITDICTGDYITVNDGDTSSASGSFNVIDPGLHHFEFEEIASPQTAGTPFQVSIAACAFYGDTVDTFTGAADLRDETGTMTPDSTGAFAGGVWTGSVTVDSVVVWDVITCDFDDGTKAVYTGASNGFEVQHQSGATGGPSVPQLAAGVFGARISPNPARTRTELALQLPREGRVTARLYNLLGQEVVSRDFGVLPAGASAVSWHLGSGLKTGVYFVSVSLDNNQRLVRRLSVVR
jgi:hypothetical protein